MKDSDIEAVPLLAPAFILWESKIRKADRETRTGVGQKAVSTIP